ncbi:14254_t:CDS:2, partial [Racocetra fulgida]
ENQSAIHLTKVELSWRSDTKIPKTICKIIENESFWQDIKSLFKVLKQLVIEIALFESDTLQLAIRLTPDHVLKLVYIYSNYKLTQPREDFQKTTRVLNSVELNNYEVESFDESFNNTEDEIDGYDMETFLDEIDDYDTKTFLEDSNNENYANTDEDSNFIVLESE